MSNYEIPELDAELEYEDPEDEDEPDYEAVDALRAAGKRVW